MTLPADIAASTQLRPALHACWSCSGPVPVDGLFCGTCRAVQPPGRTDHFARLGLPRLFALDTKALARRYFELQRQLHPDRFATRGAREKAISQSQAVTLNEAYEALRTPLGRAEYLLLLAGMPPADERSIRDPELLMEQMERREVLAGARDAAGVETCIGAAVADAMAIESELADAFASGDLQAARRGTLRLRYLQRLIDEARARHARLLGDTHA